MPLLPGVNLGMRKGPYETHWDPELAKRFAAATRDPNPLSQSGASIPPVVYMTLGWEAQCYGRDHIVNQELRNAATGGAHGEHYMIVHRPPVPGERLTTWVEAHSSVPAGRTSIAALYYPTRDEAGELVVEQWWTNILIGVTCETVGPALPDHTFPEEARQHLVGTYRVFLDKELPIRYAEVTDDWAPLHFDEERAKASGFPGLTNHGLSTLALACQGIVAECAGGDANRIRVLAARFSRPALLGHEMTVRIYQAAPAVFVFEADLADMTVIKHGLVELRD